MTMDEFSEGLGITVKELSILLTQKASITPDIAYKLSGVIGNSVEFWFNLQSNHDDYIANKDN